MRARLLIVVFLAAAVAACGKSDDNAEARYGDSGRPANCRAMVQTAIDEYHAHQYSAEATLESLERNCGASGQLWAQQ